MLRLLSIILTLTYVSDGARILGVVPTPSYSHQIVFQPIFNELAKRGHELVVVTTDPQNDPTIKNMKEIDIGFSYKIWKEHFSEVIKNNNNPFKMMQSVSKILDEMSTQQLEHPELVSLIKNKTEHFDLLMAELNGVTVFALKHRFNCPTIGLQSMETLMASHLAVGNTIHQILYPEPMVPFNGKLNFFQRLISFSMAHVFNYFLNGIYIKNENYKISKYFGEGYPHLSELRDSIDMIFINTNLAFNNIRPVTPATISIGGGIHIKELKPLPKNIKTFLDNTEAIYFSLGTNVKSTDMSLETRETILKVFSELPYNVLWKSDIENMPNIPKNVKIQKWIPQQDVLRHPNIKLFITQGGMQSLEEALLSHLPVVVMPFFGDQHTNAEKVVVKGLGVTIDHKSITENEFKDTLIEVITNPKYKNKAKELATLIKDEPMNALEKAVWWTEYVIRNKGAQHLKGPGLNLPLYQYYYLDILTFLVCTSLFIVALFYFITKKVILMFCRLIFSKKEKLQ